MPTRRNVLELLSASAVTTAVAGCAGGPSADPVAAWRNPGAGEADPRRWALAHAILAPNPHNRQPWQVELIGSDALRLFVDTNRLLPATDPPNRQIALGCGAFLELLDLAARKGGRRAEIVLWPDGEPQPVLDGRPVAHVRLVADPRVAADPLFDQITQRHTNRQPFDIDAPPTADELARIAAAAAGPALTARTVSEPGPRSRLIEIGQRAFKIEGDTKATHMETVRLMRIGAKEVAANPDGVALTGPFIEALRMTGQMSRESLADPNSFASRSGLKMWRDMLAATPAFLVLASADNSRTTQIAAGRAYARAQLTATALGLSMQPWSMALQEFPEMAGPYAETQALLGATPASPVQMLVRVGRAKPASPAPRWPLASHIRA